MAGCARTIGPRTERGIACVRGAVGDQSLSRAADSRGETPIVKLPLRFSCVVNKLGSMSLNDDQVYELFRLGVAGDTVSVRQFARRVMKSLPRAETGGATLRTRIAELLLQQSSTVVRGVATPSPVDDASFLSLLRLESSPDPSRPVLSSAEEAVLRSIVAERSATQPLMEAGLEPTKSLLLTGPPGVGKTMTARFLASSLELPLMVLDLTAVVSSYLGRTGQNLRAALDYARSSPCVLLLDEFDAIAKRRDDPSDIGELKRIVNVLLLELENWPASGLLVGATNHPELLDRAIWRRFDRVLAIPLPDRGMRVQILRTISGDLGCVIEPAIERLIAFTLEGASGSEIERIVREAVRAAVVTHNADLDRFLVQAVLNHLEPVASERARMFCACLYIHGLGLTARQAADRLSVSHVTVTHDLEKWSAEDPAAPPRRGRGRPRKTILQ